MANVEDIYESLVGEKFKGRYQEDRTIGDSTRTWQFHSDMANVYDN